MNYSHRTWLIVVCSLLGMVVWVAGNTITRPLWQMHIDVGNEGTFITDGEAAHMHGFLAYDAAERWGKRSFRWTHTRGAVTIPYALRVQPLVLDITTYQHRADEHAIPATLTLNGTMQMSLLLAEQWRTHHILVPETLQHPDYGIMVDMRSPTWRDDSGRMLGIAVDSITLRQIAATTVATPTTILLIVVALFIAGIVYRSWLMPLLIALGWFSIAYSYQPQLLPLHTLVVCYLGGVLLLWHIAHIDTHQSNAPSHTLHTSLTTTWTTSLTTIILAGCAVWLIVVPSLLGTWMIDDAFISFRYADNLLHGHGLIFNRGERVEGYTNFLWTLLIAGGLALHNEPVVFTTTFTLLLAFGTLAITYRISWHLLPHQPVWQLVVVVLLTLSSPFLLYTSRGSGMETALFTLLLAATVLALLHERWRGAGALAALTMMTRPDGGLLVAVGVLFVLWQMWHAARVHGCLWQMPLVLYLGVFAIIFVPYFVWRWQYYGYLLPNTFYVKVGSTWAQVLRGIGYVGTCTRDHILLLPAVMGVAVVVWRWRTSRAHTEPAVLLLAALVVGYTLYIISVGGDWMPGARFFVALMPLLVLLTTRGIVDIARMPQSRMRGVLVASSITSALVVLLVLRLNADSSYRHTDIWAQNYVVRRYRELGMWLHAHTTPDMVLAADVVGAMPYYAQRTTIDILGLTDEHIAHVPVAHLGTGRAGHEKTDPSYVLSRHPHIVPFKGSYHLWEHPNFETGYYAATFHGGEGYAVKLYIRNDVVLP